MKQSCLSALFAIISISMFGQTSAKINYEFISYANHKTPATLTIKDGNCWYSRHQEPATIRLDREYRAEAYVYKDHKDWYYDHSDKTIIQTWGYDKDPTFYGQWPADIKWEITEETKEIAGYKVQKATTTPLLSLNIPNIKLLTAIAWFAIDVPFSFGPEGYHGLPGLIVKLEHEGINLDDPNKTKVYVTYSATLKKVEYTSVKNWDLPTGNGKIKIEKEQFDHLEKIDDKWLKEQKKLLKKQNK